MALGEKTPIPDSPHKAGIDVVINPHPDQKYFVRLTIPEFTSLCPVTGQPDFAHIVIDYVPNERLIESKSLKLFMFSFRNHGGFHEDCTVLIGKKLTNASNPLWMRVCGFWFPRGGIPIDVFWEYGELPTNMKSPSVDVPMYRGR